MAKVITTLREGRIVENYISKKGQVILYTAPKSSGGYDDKGIWNPEEGLAGLLGSCVVLVWDIITSNSKFEFKDIKCELEARMVDIPDKPGIKWVDKIWGKVTITVYREEDVEKAKQLFDRTLKVCPIGNSLKSEKEIEVEVVVEK